MPRTRKRAMTDMEVMKEIARLEADLKGAIDSQSLLTVASGLAMHREGEALPQRHVAHEALMKFIDPYLSAARRAEDEGSELSVLQTRVLAAADIALEFPARNLVGASKAFKHLLEGVRQG